MPKQAPKIINQQYLPQQGRVQDFHRRGRQPTKGKISEKLHKIEKISIRHCTGAYLNPRRV